MPPSVASTSPSRRIAVGIGLLLTIGLAGLHLQFHWHAGALWRDEVNSVNIAVLPTVSQVFAKIPFDSFPAVWLLVLHAWVVNGFGDTDADLRRLGLLIGLAAVAAMWWTGRRLGLDAPLVTLLLLGMSPTAIIYGDEVRGYGLAVLGLVCCVGAIWSFLEAPTWQAFLVAQLATLLAVQTHFGNCFLLLAICAGAVAVCLRQRAAWKLAGVAALGLIAALSMLIDLHALTYSRSLWPMLQEEFSLRWLVTVFLAALAPEAPALSVLWGVVACLAAIGCILTWRAPSGAAVDADKNRALFAAVTFSVGLISFYVAVKYVAKLRTEYWYYLPLMALIALLCDVGVDLLTRRLRWGGWIRIGGVGLGALLVAGDVSATVRLRMTNLDVIASVLERDARANDLIVVLPWYCGIAFQRYYHGAAPWMTLPDFDQHSLHLHLLVAEKMQQGDAGIAAELDRVERTLHDGGRIWLVAGMEVTPPPGQAAASLPPAPNGPEGWKVGPYLDGWNRQLGAQLRMHGREFWRIPLPDHGPVNFHEALPLFLVEGGQ